VLTTLAELLALFDLVPLGGDAFRGTQPDPPNHHIVGSQIAAQALLAASRTTPQRPPHSLHVYFLRRGDARRPVDFEVTRLHDGGTFSARRVTASQDGRLLAEVMASFTTGVDGADYQGVMPDVPPPQSLEPIERQLAPYADEFGGWWISERPFDVRYVDPPPRIAADSGEPPSATSRIWLRPRGAVPLDPVINTCLLTYLSGLTLLEPTLGPMGKSATDVSALLDHSVWFHRPADFSDWLLYEQHSPTGIAGRALATGRLYNVAGALVATVGQEGYFPPTRK
jgi:acyl-CoA thioesterase-2